METDSILFEQLDGALLVAMPGIGDLRFEKSVIYLCSHSQDGTMGLIINKPAADLDFHDLLMQLDISIEMPRLDTDVYFGGPVEHGRGFVLHSTDYTTDSSTLEINQDFSMTASVEILEDIANGEGPSQSLLALGYAGWEPGQLEAEIRGNGWLVAKANPSIVFSGQHERKWQEALGLLGIDPHLLHNSKGKA